MCFNQYLCIIFSKGVLYSCDDVAREETIGSSHADNYIDKDDVVDTKEMWKTNAKKNTDTFHLKVMVS